jgi:hypothetical protein
MASGNVRGRRQQKVTSNRKKFKKHLTDEYELWEELNGTALSEIYESCTQSIQLLIGKKESAAEVWKQLESSFAVSGFASVEQQILKLQELSYSSCKSLQDFINRLTTAKEHLEALSIQLPQAYYIVQLLRGPVRYAPMRYTPVRCTLMRYTPMKYTPMRRMLMRCTLMRYTPMRHTPMRCTLMRYTPTRCTPVRLP